MEELDARQKILTAILNHVAFDGWSDTSFKAAIDDSGVNPALAEVLFPRGGIDLALAYHKAGDEEMRTLLAKEELSQMRFRDRIAHAVMLRLSLADREAVRRGTSLMALPQYALEGSRALWSTADAIWSALGDRSDDFNHYSKRATLSAVYASTVLFWLGDDSEELAATRAFLDRRIEGVMAFEKAKTSPLGKALTALPPKIFSAVKAPQKPSDLPGQMGRKI